MASQSRVGAGVPLEAVGLTKRFGPVTAVADLSFAVAAGRVTGFLGPNGAGKTTTLRCLLGLARPTAGRALVQGRPYAALREPLRSVGAAVETTGFHPGRSARNHLAAVAQAAGLPPGRVPAVLGMVALEAHADRRVGGYSLGMRQRLALAQALLGDPAVLVLDEPANGLDPAGIAWLRGLLRMLADEGRTVLVSSHVLSEVQQTVDDVVVVVGGRLVTSGRLADLEGARAAVRVRTPDRDALVAALAGRPGVGSEPDAQDSQVLLVRGAPLAEVGAVAHRAGVELHELAATAGDLERLFLELTERSRQ